MDPVNLEMLKQAANAARDGDYENARELVSSVLANDEENVRAWLMLARLSESDDEKRMALTTVLNLAPGNERAQKMLNVLDATSMDTSDDIVPGVSRRQFQLLAGGLIGLVLVLLLIVIFVNSRQSTAESNAANTELAFTQSAQRAAAFGTEIAQSTGDAQTQAAAQITQAWLTEITPTPSATFTPSLTPTATPTDTRPSALPPVDLGLTGIIAAWSQETSSQRDNLALVTFPANANGAAQRTLMGELEGKWVSLSPDGQVVLYSVSERSGDEMSMAGVDGSDRRFGINALNAVGASLPETGRFSPDGSQYAFTAQVANGTTELFLMTLPVDLTQLLVPTALPPDQDPPPSPFSAVQLTVDDTGNYSFPSFSPDGSQIVVVREDISEDNPGVDLAIITVGNRTRTVLTNDRNARVESHVTWSPTGNLIVYSAVDEGSETHDLYLVSTDGNILPDPLAPSPADDVYPQYSPDGRYLAFSSNRAADYNIFVVDMSTRELIAQLTDQDRPIFMGDWVDPVSVATPEATTEP